jgi:hypothetical protein
MIALFTDAGVHVITFAPHTTHIFQVLDLTPCDTLKRHPRCRLPFGDENATAEFAMKVDHDLKHTVMEGKIWRAFLAF